MFIRFIAHAGIAIRDGETTVLIDPWFQDSSLQQPLIEGLSGAQTIDFQLPKTKEKLTDYQPDAILVSHFHPHHSPARDIFQLARQSAKVTIAYPASVPDIKVCERFAGMSQVTLKPTKHGEVLHIGSLFIKAWEHTTEGHVAWSVESSSGHILHISDARIHKDFGTRIDPVWEQFKGQDFDIVFLTAGKGNIVTKKNGVSVIFENCILSPVQAAYLTRLLSPKAVALIGIYNHSLAANWIEYRMSVGECESEFRWALDWLVPKIKFIPIRPGYTFGIGDKKLLGTTDSYFE